MKEIKSPASNDPRVKKKIIGFKGFILSYVVLMLLAGVQFGILIFPPFQALHPIFQICIILIYWAFIALSFTFITNIQIKESYDMPMRRLGEAAKKVADGDFSVYAEPIHTPDDYDYIDVMFLDFNKMVQELGSIETLKNDFVANVSHEIKTPLAVIKNYSTILKNDSLSVETRNDYINTINAATDKLTNLVSNILRLNKLENQEIEVATAEYDLCRQLSDCILSFESVWEEKNIELLVEIEDRAIITADESMLEIVWNNLLSNALKYTEQGGKITLTQTSEADSITVTVSDTGCGMDEQVIKHIFDKFYQADTSHSSEGNGLGLALAYRVLEKQGGSLTVSSEPGKGSTFTAIIPIKYY